MSQLGTIIGFCVVCYAGAYSAAKGYFHARNSSQ